MGRGRKRRDRVKTEVEKNGKGEERRGIG